MGYFIVNIVQYTYLLILRFCQRKPEENPLQEQHRRFEVVKDCPLMSIYSTVFFTFPSASLILF